ncbi:glycoside hydrolase family 13 protein [Sinosporangium siamense]|uniref:Alpha-glucosidase n=1 Tax=Sinosporangium siamense TaxID=1367973 RepID=A0A919RNG8_9ACTN|nr:glycoside hydrolase family 13 protein [Sinosporangium siamense]GII96095.1 alpha-glucosidase [Sinosporangium siamense]
MIDEWWRDAVIYQVYVRSFRDSGGDGVGDLPGVRAALPYLKELGVDGLWLNPFYPSPQHDHGYDISDFCGINPEYGTLDDFDALVAEAHALGIRIIVDVVPNHCSIEHPLFLEALLAGPGSAARRRFHFAEGHGEEPPNNWRSMFGGPAWERTADGQWYLHLFTPEQPDLNWRHPDVPALFEDVLRFWLDRGVDGFRVDAAQGLFKHPALPDAEDPAEEERVGDAANELAWNRPEVHDVYRSWRRICDTYAARDGVDRPLIGELTGIAQNHLGDYVRPGEMHQGFYFGFLDAPWDGAAFRAVVDRGLANAAATGSTVTWVLGNHDRVRVATRFGGGAPGLSAGDFERGTARARAGALLVLALPGSTYIYQGEELGLPEVVDLPLNRLTDPIHRRTDGERRGRDGCRVPLPWSGEAPPYGFSTSPDLWLPQPPSFAEHTVERVTADPGSTWHLYRGALGLRRKALAGEPELRWLDAPPGVLAFTRGDGFTCVVNCTDAAVPAPLPGEPTLASGPVRAGEIPAETAAWWVR